MSAPAVLPKGPFTCGAPDCGWQLGHEGPHAVPDYVPLTPDPELYNWPLGQPKPLETQSLPSHEASVEPQGAAADASPESPSAVREAEAQLILRFTHLQEKLPKTTAQAAIWAGYVRSMKAEMAEIERLLRAHKRLREPIKRRAK
jgi:hypothetical protein